MHDELSTILYNKVTVIGQSYIIVFTYWNNMLRICETTEVKQFPHVY